MFCGCSTTLGAEPNTQVLPGLPRPARRCRRQCHLGRRGGDPDRSGAELRDRDVVPVRPEEPRFYPDMPKNFQTSQYDEPIAFGGHLDVDVEDGDRPGRDRARPHGGDTGKSPTSAERPADPRRTTRSWTTTAPASRSSRSSPPIVGAPEAPEAAGRMSPKLRDLLRALGVSDVRMEQGSMRCDVNLSLSPVPAPVRHAHRDQERQLAACVVERAVRYEITRHAGDLDGGSILQETRHWHEDTGVTTSGREKSDAEGLSLLPRARPGADRACAGLGSRTCVPPCPSRRPAPQATAGGVLLLGPGDARRPQRRCSTSSEETVTAGGSPAAALNGGPVRPVRANAEARTSPRMQRALVSARPRSWS